ncbi:uncharacterized protein LOC119666466 [Teleopsis dalmanni]|uniref:uncharacterized protein LOC119666463 n=1 Tax=Teleopsis dalmanni TaxID=139649 RepID=UPI0018CE8E4F|nr:uncharacterized protein LOC119666463 [Teleopsis dalmanni]XP_037931671.1 uncharacterized protein LOC119666466 [Teleopsis dalmanni]
MLKWAVKGARQSYLQTLEPTQNEGAHTKRYSLDALSIRCAETPSVLVTTTERRKLKRKSSDMHLLRRRTQWLEKENHMTSTPLNSTHSYASTTHIRRLNSLKDLSNITPVQDTTSPKCRHSLKYQHCAQTPLAQKTKPTNNMPKQYASTLPTFDIQYSPCGLVPGPMLALRGMGIADTYFEKPRYLNVEQLSNNTTEQISNIAETKSITNKTAVRVEKTEEVSLTSSQMGDVTLERMIDAILESTRKEKKLPKHFRQLHATAVMSPTYTPADDPASDLHEFWHKGKYHQEGAGAEQKYNEREVRSPGISTRVRRNNSFHLRRQRAVRRKHKLNKINSSIKNSAQRVTDVNDPQNSNLYSKLLQKKRLTEKASTEQAPGNKNNCFEKRPNVSPDSGHNSSNELEDYLLENNSLQSVDLENRSNICLDATKRRLNFSNSNIN